MHVFFFFFLSVELDAHAFYGNLAVCDLLITGEQMGRILNVLNSAALSSLAGILHCTVGQFKTLSCDCAIFLKVYVYYFRTVFMCK